MRAALALLALLLAGACASLSEEECRAGDWRAIGFADGAAGRPADYVARHREACAEVGVSPDLDAWLAGREAGLARYCTPANAFDVGRSGRRLSPVCAGPGLPDLERANRAGLRYWEIGREIAAIEADLREIDFELAALGDSDSERRARRRLRDEAFRLQDHLARLRFEQVEAARRRGRG